jgi:sugar lactone lactonase YvrE
MRVQHILCCSLLILTSLGQDTNDAAMRFAQLRKDATEARSKHDSAALLKTVRAMAELLNDSGPSEERLAFAYAAKGDSLHAMEALRAFASMGQADDDLLSAPELSKIRTLPEFQNIAKQMETNKSPVGTGVTLMQLDDPGLLVEDIDYDPQSHDFYVTSVLKKKIVRVAARGRQQDFGASPEGWPMLAIKIDARRHVLWATEVALDDFSAAPKSDWGRSAVLCFSLDDGHLLRRIEGPPKSALGDMALTAGGDAIVSDGAGGGVYRAGAGAAASERLERLDAGDFISPQTPAVLADGKRVFVPDYARGIGILDLATKNVAWIDSGRRHALQGIDGMYFREGELIAVQNGASPERVAVFRMDTGLTRVVSEKIIERATPTLGDPTHGVIVGNTFYYIANSGWSELDDHGQVKPGAKLSRARIMKVELN